MFFHSNGPSKAQYDMVINIDEIIDESGRIRINAIHNSRNVGHAICKYTEKGDIDFSWLETEDTCLGRGVASQLVDYLCEKASKEAKKLIINVVDEDVLQGFYFKWFRKHTDEDNQYPNKVQKYFQGLLSEKGDKHFNSNHPTLVLTPESIAWRPEAKKNQRKKNPSH